MLRTQTSEMAFFFLSKLKDFHKFKKPLYAMYLFILLKHLFAIGKQEVAQYIVN